MNSVIINHATIIFITIAIALLLGYKLIDLITRKIFLQISFFSKIKIELLENLIKPSSILITFSLIFISYICLLHSQYEKIDYIIFKSVKILEVLIIFWLLNNIIETFVLHFVNHKKIKITNLVSKSVVIFFLKNIRVAIIVITALFILNILGVNVSALVTGVGLFGIAVALAAKDTLKNFFSSIVILLDQVFVEGDYIKIDEIEGHIKHIGFRSTTLETKNQEIAFIPNAKFADGAVLNVSKIPLTPLYIKINISRKTDNIITKKFIADIKKYIQDNELFIPEKSNTYINSLSINNVSILCVVMAKININTDILILIEDLIEVFTKISIENNIHIHSIQVPK